MKDPRNFAIYTSKTYSFLPHKIWNQNWALSRTTNNQKLTQREYFPSYFSFLQINQPKRGFRKTSHSQPLIAIESIIKTKTVSCKLNRSFNYVGNFTNWGKGSDRGETYKGVSPWEERRPRGESMRREERARRVRSKRSSPTSGWSPTPPSDTRRTRKPRSTKPSTKLPTSRSFAYFDRPRKP